MEITDRQITRCARCANWRCTRRSSVFLRRDCHAPERAAGIPGEGPRAWRRRGSLKRGGASMAACAWRARRNRSRFLDVVEAIDGPITSTAARAARCVRPRHHVRGTLIWLGARRAPSRTGTGAFWQVGATAAARAPLARRLMEVTQMDALALARWQFVATSVTTLLCAAHPGLSILLAVMETLYVRMARRATSAWCSFGKAVPDQLSPWGW